MPVARSTLIQKEQSFASCTLSVEATLEVKTRYAVRH